MKQFYFNNPFIEGEDLNGIESGDMFMISMQK